MHKRLLPTVLFSVILIPPAAAHAQERGQTGIVVGYPTNIALIWHASDRLAIRPEVAFSHSSSETESSFFGTVSFTDSWNVTVGASALWYMAKTDNVRTYFSPRLTYSRNRSDSSFSTSDPVSTNVSLAGSFGAEYSPVRKFSVFGEVGYGFNHGWSKFTTPISTSEGSAWNWAPRTAVGAIFYFGR